MATKKLDEPMIGFLSAPLEPSKQSVKSATSSSRPTKGKTRRRVNDASADFDQIERRVNHSFDLKKSAESDDDESVTASMVFSVRDGVDQEYVLQLLRELEQLSDPKEYSYSFKELTNRDTLQKRGFTAYVMLRSLDLSGEEVIEVAKVLCEMYLGHPTPPWEKVKELASDTFGQYIVTSNVAEYLGKGVEPSKILVTVVTAQCMRLEAAVLSTYVETLWAMQSWMRPDQREVDAAFSNLRGVTKHPVTSIRMMNIGREERFPSGYQLEITSHPHLNGVVNSYFEKLTKTMNRSEAFSKVQQLAKLLFGEAPRKKEVERASAELVDRADPRNDLDKLRLSRDAQFLANEMGAEALGRRIRRWRQRNNLSATDLAKLIGVSVQAVSSWENGYTPPSYASIKLMAICFGIPAQTLELGVQDDEPSAKPQATNGSFDERYVEVNLYDVQFSAGSGNLAPEYHLDEEAEPLAFRRSFFQNKGIDPKYARCFRVDGDSMQPYLEDGNIVLVDCREVSRIKDGKVYAVRYADELRVKRLKRSFEGDYVLLSDNADYEPVTIPRDAENFAIIGEVRWRAG